MRIRNVLYIAIMLACMILSFYTGKYVQSKYIWYQGKKLGWASPLINRRCAAKFNVTARNRNTIQINAFQCGNEESFPTTVGIDWNAQAYAAKSLPDIFLDNSFWNNARSPGMEHFAASPAITVAIRCNNIFSYLKVNQYGVFGGDYPLYYLYEYTEIPLANITNHHYELYPCKLIQTKSFTSNSIGQLTSDADLNQCNFLLIPTEQYAVFDNHRQPVQFGEYFGTYYIVDLNYLNCENEY